MKSIVVNDYNNDEHGVNNKYVTFIAITDVYSLIWLQKLTQGGFIIRRYDSGVKCRCF